MDQLFQEIYKKSGYIGLLLIFLIYIFKDSFKSFLDLILKQLAGLRGNRIEKKTELKFHPFFIFMNFQINYGISTIHLYSEIKTKILMDFLRIKFTIFRDGFLTLTDDSINTLSKDELKDRVFTLFTDCIANYNEEAILFFRERLEKHDKVSVDDDIDMIVTKFRQWNQRTIDLTAKNMEMVLDDDDYYPSNRAKISAVLLMLKIGFDFVVHDGIDSFNEMNGKLEMVKYK
jgi:hypothetical protein